MNCQISIIATFSILSMLLFAILDNAVSISAQQASILPHTPKLHAVKITTPTKGQQVPIGKDLIVSGVTASTAIPNNAAFHCQVFVITNGVKPYQPATATGPGGPADYSKWNFVLTPKYTTIKQGPNNKITSKYTCTGRNSATTSFYSVNITGIQATTAASKQHEQQTTAAATTNTSAEGKKMPASMSSISHGADPLQPARLAYLGVPHTPHYSINTSVDQSVSITKPEFDPHIFPNIIVPFG